MDALPPPTSYAAGMTGIAAATQAAKRRQARATQENREAERPNAVVETEADDAPVAGSDETPDVPTNLPRRDQPSGGQAHIDVRA